MLCLTRKVGESIQIGDDIVVKVSEVRGGRVRIAIEAPRMTTILRTECAGQPKPVKKPMAKAAV